MSMPELERRRGDDRLAAARPSARPRPQALLARERAVVRAHEVLLGELVQPRGQPFGHAAGVHEHDRGAVRADQLEQLRVDRRPDRGAIGLIGELPRAVPRPAGRPSSAMSSTGTITSSSIGLRWPASTTATSRGRSGASSRRGIARSPRADAAWPTARSAAAGRRVSASEPLERERQVRAALRRGHRVDLVDDHPAERCAASRAPGDVSIR